MSHVAAEVVKTIEKVKYYTYMNVHVAVAFARQLWFTFVPPCGGVVADSRFLSSESTVRYESPEGEMRDEVNLTDVSYDGVIREGYMYGGLGQLVDRMYGHDDFEFHDSASGDDTFRLFIYFSETIFKTAVTLITSPQCVTALYPFSFF